MSFNVETRLSRLRASAKARGLNVNLDVNKYQNLINCGCHYCGTSLAKEKGYCLDRVDSSKGYNLTNVVPCCKKCNIAKNSMPIMEFVEWLERAYKHTSSMIAFVRKMEAQGDFYSLEEEINTHESLSENKPKNRIKEVYK